MSKKRKEQLELIEQVKQNSSKAGNLLIKKNQGLIHKEVNKYAKNAEEKKDLAQEASIALINAAKSYDEEKNKSFYYYALVCINNALYDWIKKEQKAPITSQYEYTEEFDALFVDLGLYNDLELMPISKEESEEIDNLLKQTLSERQRESLILFANGYTYKEIAEILGLEEKQVDNAINIARRKLKGNEEIKKMRDRNLKNKNVIKSK
ncbi:MAG TPA: sigma-70 family RNA polymerase sigma factor [Clostridiales bacterium]|nr:sigma-70 family RNA polymerase sigma factor [Clostridiales bacterium]